MIFFFSKNIFKGRFFILFCFGRGPPTPTTHIQTTILIFGFLGLIFNLEVGPV